MGVAFWILPRFNKGAPRGDERLAWLALFLINTGILFVLLDFFLDSAWLMFTARATEMLALTVFVLGHWRRIKPFDP